MCSRELINLRVDCKNTEVQKSKFKVAIKKPKSSESSEVETNDEEVQVKSTSFGLKENGNKSKNLEVAEDSKYNKVGNSSNTEYLGKATSLKEKDGRELMKESACTTEIDGNKDSNHSSCKEGQLGASKCSPEHIEDSKESKIAENCTNSSMVNIANADKDSKTAFTKDEERDGSDSEQTDIDSVTSVVKKTDEKLQIMTDKKPQEKTDKKPQVSTDDKPEAKTSAKQTYNWNKSREGSSEMTRKKEADSETNKKMSRELRALIIPEFVRKASSPKVTKPIAKVFVPQKPRTMEVVLSRIPKGYALTRELEDLGLKEVERMNKELKSLGSTMDLELKSLGFVDGGTKGCGKNRDLVCSVPIDDIDSDEDGDEDNDDELSFHTSDGLSPDSEDDTDNDDDAAEVLSDTDSEVVITGQSRSTISNQVPKKASFAPPKLSGKTSRDSETEELATLVHSLQALLSRTKLSYEKKLQEKVFISKL